MATTERAPCLEESTIWGLLHGGLAREGVASARNHLDQCGDCRMIVANLVRSLDLKSPAVAVAEISRTDGDSQSSIPAPIPRPGILQPVPLEPNECSLVTAPRRRRPRGRFALSTVGLCVLGLGVFLFSTARRQSVATAPPSSPSARPPADSESQFLPESMLPRMANETAARRSPPVVQGTASPQRPGSSRPTGSALHPEYGGRR
jgi:hypothetical protein